MADCVFPIPTTIILVSPLWTGPAKQVELDAIDHEDTGRFVGDAVHPHIAGRDGAELHHIHRRADRHSGSFFSQSKRLDHRPLTVGRAAIVGTHGGEQERASTLVAEPVAGGAQDGGDVADATAASGDGQIAARDQQSERIELSMDRGADIREWIRDKSLADAEKIHCRSNYSEKRVFRGIPGGS